MHNTPSGLLRLRTLCLLSLSCLLGSLAAAATPPATATPGIAAALTIDLRALPNYARPALPPHYTAQVQGLRNTPPDNPVTNRGATLGRVLFWDRRLSVNNSVSCASCHQQGQGFGTLARVSKGFLGQAGTAHAMGLGNLVYYKSGQMFWDKRAPTLEAQSTQPIQNSLEMGYDHANGGMAALLVKMQALPYYPELFTAVYGDPAITEPRIQRALAQFMRAMLSTDSRWDRGRAKTWNPALPDQGRSLPLPTLTVQENRGQALFMAAPRAGGAGCAGCHEPPTFALKPGVGSNGLDAGETRVFKSASLKTMTPGQPMMHDGRFTRLEDVVRHYAQGVQDGPALDARLRTPDGLPRQLRLSSADQAALVAFLKTLEDPSLKTDPRFSNPFRR